MTRDWHAAVTSGDAERVVELLDAGVDPDVRDGYSQTGLMLAARGGHTEVVRLLAARGASLDATAKFGLSAMMLAVLLGHRETALELVRLGANRGLTGTGAPGFAGKTAFDLASELGIDGLLDALRP